MTKRRRNRMRWVARRAIVEHERRKQRMMDAAAEHAGRVEARLTVALDELNRLGALVRRKLELDALRREVLAGRLEAQVRSEADAEIAARVGLLTLVDGGQR